MTEPRKELQATQFGLMASGIENIFQSGNPKFYVDATLMEKQTDIFAMILQSMKDAGARYIDQFNMEDPELSDMWMVTGENGTFMSHFSYLFQDKRGVKPVEKSVFLAGKFDLNEDKLIHRITPFYYMQGITEIPNDTNGERVFFPMETGCLTNLDDQDGSYFRFAKNMDEFVQTLCYGRKAFEMILTKKTISVPALSYWTADENLNEADQEYTKMVLMPPEQFEQMIDWEKKVQAHNNGASFIGLPTPTRN